MMIEKTEATGYQVLLQNQISALVEALNKSIPIEFGVEISQNGRLIFASSNEFPDKPWIFARNGQISSANGNYALKILINTAPLMIWNVTAFFILIALLGLIYARERTQFDRHLRPLYEETATLVAEIESVSKNLDKDSISLPPHSKIVELESVSSALRQFAEKIGDQKKRIAELSYAAAFGDLAKQVAHDIRSPLTVLNTLAATVNDVPEEKRAIVRSATQRINDIANGLLADAKRSTSVRFEQPMPGSSDIGGALRALLQEVKVKYRGLDDIEICSDLSQGEGAYTSLSIVELSRIISNLISNSVEAIPGAGKVQVSIRGYKDRISVIVSDNGIGMPEDVLAQVGKKGFSFGKSGNRGSGTGLGIHHAKITIESAGGTFSIQSKLGTGTMVTLSLPRIHKDHQS
ncbi:MAG: HAMP domain-containing histidine kinase [Bdellovibrionaceae bacterium]|nr:HAMP domain-containing histidine kinase [Pseudobdellovibrionaceae bacterium]